MSPNYRESEDSQNTLLIPTRKWSFFFHSITNPQPHRRLPEGKRGYIRASEWEHGALQMWVFTPGPSPIFVETSGPKLEKEPAEGVYIWTQPWRSTITLFQFSSWVSTSGPSPAARKARVLKGKVCSTGLLDQLVYMAAYKYLVILW